MAGEWEKAKHVKEIQSYLAWANTFISVLTFLETTDVEFSWHKKLQSEQLMLGKPQQSSPSGFDVKCFTVAYSLHGECQLMLFGGNSPPKGSKSGLDLTSFLSLQLQKWKFSEHSPLALDFLIHEWNQTPIQVRRHVPELNPWSLSPHCRQ